MKTLPYRAQTGTGDVFDIEFPLHHQTGSAVRVGQLISTVLSAIDKDIAIAGDVSNGDVLQAVAMALAIRAGMIHGRSETAERLSAEFVITALDAVAKSSRQVPKAGHA